MPRPISRRPATARTTNYDKYARKPKKGGRLRTCALLLVLCLVVGYVVFAMSAILTISSEPAAAAAVVDDAIVTEEEEKMSVELDPRTGMMLPRFWEPPPGDLEDMVDKRDGEATIFLMIASYRDFQCRETIASALSRARFPGRIVVAAVQQNGEGDVGCAEPAVPCSEDPLQPLCARASQIKVFEMNADEASGPVYARHIGYRMYRGEAYAMQVDAHVVFVNDWDVLIEKQWESAGNEMAVLSTYLTDLSGSIDENGDSKRKTRPIMCNSAFEGAPPARYLRHGAQPEEEPVVHGQPMMQPFWAAGMSFARGHFIHRVPYDCCLPMVFMGEEISLGIRGWTHGYDMYTPEASVLFHEYASRSKRRNKVHLFWENSGSKKKQRPDAARQSLKRLTALIGMAPDVEKAGDYDRTDADIYGLGTKRSVELFYKLFLVDVERRESQPLCKFIKTGVMHRDFAAHMRPDKRGVDYSELEDYDTAAAIENELSENHRPHGRQALTKAMRMNERGWLKNAIDEAVRAEMDKSPVEEDRELLKKARQALADLPRH